jgi:hypothetical protein
VILKRERKQHGQKFEGLYTLLQVARQTDEHANSLCSGHGSFRFTSSTNESVTQQTNGISNLAVWRTKKLQIHYFDEQICHPADKRNQ